MKKFLLALVVLSTITANCQTDTSKQILYEGTEVHCKISKDISGKNAKVGDQIEFTVAKNVVVGDKILVNEGTRVVGTVTEASGSKALGKKGKLEFSIDYLYLPNGRPVKLRSSVEKQTNGRGALVATTAVLLSPLALFIKGKQAKFEEGTEFIAYVDKDTYIQ